MRKVRVVGFSAVLGAGKLALTEGQAIPRVEAGLLAPTTREGIYEVTGPVEFKCGETFGYDGDFSPVLLEDIAPLKVADQVEADAAAAAKAVTDARITELEALGDAITEDELAELNNLLSE